MRRVTNRFEYYNGENETTSFRISASGISRFFTSTSRWFAENLTDTAEGFTGNTSSVLGTLVHGHLEAYVKGEAIDPLEVDEYLTMQSTTVDDLDVNYIKYQLPIMVQVAIEYLQDTNLGTAERFIFKDLLPGICVGGSIDLHTDNVVIDYKTTSAKAIPKNIAYAHKIQLLTYAKLLRDEGINITSIRIVYVTTDIDGGISEKTGKPLKSYPSDVQILEEAILPEDLEMIDNIWNVIAESVALFRDKPELHHILSQDMRLRSVKCTLQKLEEEEI